MIWSIWFDFNSVGGVFSSLTDSPSTFRFLQFLLIRPDLHLNDLEQSDGFCLSSVGRSFKTHLMYVCKETQKQGEQGEKITPLIYLCAFQQCVQQKNSRWYLFKTLWLLFLLLHLQNNHKFFTLFISLSQGKSSHWQSGFLDSIKNVIRIYSL